MKEDIYYKCVINYKVDRIKVPKGVILKNKTLGARFKVSHFNASIFVAQRVWNMLLARFPKGSITFAGLYMENPKTKQLGELDWTPSQNLN